jgi:hypothetical protein
MQDEKMDWLLDCRKNSIGSSYKEQIMYSTQWHVDWDRNLQQR